MRLEVQSVGKNGVVGREVLFQPSYAIWKGLYRVGRDVEIAFIFAQQRNVFSYPR